MISPLCYLLDSLISLIFIVFKGFYILFPFYFPKSPQHLPCKYIDEESNEEHTDEGFYGGEPAACVTFWLDILRSQCRERCDAEEEAVSKVCFS